jgi:fucose permease
VSSHADGATRRLSWTGYYTLTLVGIYIAAIGPGLPSIARHAGIPLDQAGTLLTALFAGGLVTSIGAGRATDRFGRRPLLVAGCLVNGLGALLLSLAGSWAAVLFAGLLLGIGDSTLVVGSHVLFADLHPGASGAALNRLNVFFGVGALVGPALAGLSLLLAGDIRFAFWLVAVGQAGAAVSFLRSRFPAPIASDEEAPLGVRQLVRRPLLWWLALLIFVYVGLEIGLGNWNYTYLRSAGGIGVGAASLLSSGFWLMLTLGRALSPLALRRLSEPGYLFAACCAAAVLALLLVGVAQSRPAGAVCILLLGLVFGPIWPVTFAVGTSEYSQGAGAATGLITTAGSIGGLVTPWLLGVLLGIGPRPAMALVLAGAAAMALLAGAVRRALASPTLAFAGRAAHDRGGRG